MSKNKPANFRIVIDGYGSAEVVARTAGAAVCRARRKLKARTLANRAEGGWKNVHLEVLPC